MPSPVNPPSASRNSVASKIMVMVANFMRLGRKRFFFEKKKQKTFAGLGQGRCRTSAPRSDSLFGFSCE
jgi:hypothetical protein